MHYIKSFYMFRCGIKLLQRNTTNRSHHYMEIMSCLDVCKNMYYN